MTTQEGPPRPSSLMVSALTALIVLTYVAFWFASPAQQDWATYAFALNPARFVPHGEYAFTNWYNAAAVLGHTLLHSAWWHAGINAFFLFGAGRFVAVRLGEWRFLAVYIVSALMSAAFFVAFHWGQWTTAGGASGAVCGVFMAYFMSLRPSWRQSLADPAIGGQLAVIVFINVVLMGLLSAFDVVAVGWEGHLGGFIGGFLAYIALEPRRSAPV